MKLIRKILTRSSQRRRGQAAVEFLMTMVVVFFFLFFLASLSILFVVSNYVHYATFMAARTYKSGVSTEARARGNAQIVFDSYVNRIQPLARNFKLQFDTQTQANDVRTSGILASYDVDLFYLPPVFVSGGGEATKSRITLNSEVHLGRDPSFEECQNYFSQFASKAGVGQDFLDLMEDNGC